MTMTHTEFEMRLRACGFDPLAVANFRPRERTIDQLADENPETAETVYPLLTASTNKNNVNNGYTPDGGAIGVVPQQLPAVAIEVEQRSNGPASDGCAIDAATEEIATAAIEVEQRTNGLAPSLATQDDKPIDAAPPSPVGENTEVEESEAYADTMPAPFYLKVDLFDNGTGKTGKKKGNRYKVKIHYNMEDGGKQFSYQGSFHPVARGFRANVPEGYERDPFYTEIDHGLDEANLRNNRWRIRPVGAKFKDENHHVMIYTAAIVFWDAEEEHPAILLHLQGWSVEVTLNKRPTGSPGSSNLLAYGIWLNPDMKVEREVFENKRGGKTLLETMRLQQMGLK